MSLFCLGLQGLGTKERRSEDALKWTCLALSVVLTSPSSPSVIKLENQLDSLLLSRKISRILGNLQNKNYKEGKATE
jgi:hypothetical protein